MDTLGSIEAADRLVIVVVPAAAFPFSEAMDEDLDRDEYDPEEYDLDLDREEYEVDLEYDRSRFLRLARFIGSPSPCRLDRSSSE